MAVRGSPVVPVASHLLDSSDTLPGGPSHDTDAIYGYPHSLPKPVTTVFISDLHLTPDNPGLIGHFERFFENLLSNDTKRLFILGDLFEYWLGDDSSGYLGQDTFEQQLKRASDAGIDTSLIHGNRDFLLGQAFCTRTGCKLLAEPYLLDEGGHRILLLHGDSLCTEDIEHQRFRNMVRSSEWQKSFLERSIVDRNQLALQVRYRSEQGKSLKPMDIMDVNDQAVTHELDKAAVRTMIHGHTHRPDIHRILHSDGSVAFRVVLGDWSQGPSYAELTTGHLTLYHADSYQEINLGQ